MRKRATKLFETFLIGFAVSFGTGLMLHHYFTFN
jgi:hypothetical protein